MIGLTDYLLCNHIQHLYFSLKVVDVLAATIQYELKSVSDGRVIPKDRDNLCLYASEFCSIAAGGSKAKENLVNLIKRARLTKFRQLF